MVKKRFLIIILLILNLCTFSVCAQEGSTNYSIYDYYSDYEHDFSDINVKVNEVDYVFVGKPTKLIETIKINIYGYDEVYSLYEVKITNLLKGNIETKEINILYFGGIYNDTLYISDPNLKTNNDKLPEIGKFYIFSCNFYEIFKPNVLDYEDVFYIENPYSMIYLENFLVFLPNLNAIYKKHFDTINNDIEIIEPSVINSTKTASLIHLEGPPPGGGGGETGTSYENAIPLTEGVAIDGYLSNNNPKYYKLTMNSSELVTIESLYGSLGTDVKATLYSSGEMLLDEDDNSSYGSNFLIDRILTPSFYYVKVEAASPNPIGNGNFKIRYSFDTTCHCDNSVYDLLLPYQFDLVTSSKHLVVSNHLYYDRTSYYNELLEAINIWDSMGYVDVSFNDNPLVAQVYVYDINEPNHLYSGRFIGPLSVIYFNTAHMDNWTYE